MKSNSADCRSSRPFAVFRALTVMVSVAASATLAGCASDSHMADNSPWIAAGNNGGKVDRYAIARAAAANASVQVASTPAAAGGAQ